MSYRKVNYKKGDWFGIPLPGGGWALGRIVVAATPILFGYFFGPRRKSFPDPEDIKSVNPGQAVLLALFGDLGLVNGEWKVIGAAAPSDEGWIFPSFARIDSVSGTPYVVTYSSTDLSSELEYRKSTRQEVARLPQDGVWGYEAIQTMLDKILSS